MQEGGSTGSDISGTSIPKTLLRSFIRKVVSWVILIGGLAIAMVSGQLFRPGLGEITDKMAGGFVFMLLTILIGMVFLGFLTSLSMLSQFVGRKGLIAMAGACGAMVIVEFNTEHAAAMGIGLLLSEGLLAAAVAVIVTGRFRSIGTLRKAGTILVVMYGISVNGFMLNWLLSSGTDNHLTPSPAWEANVDSLEAQNPAQIGSYTVKTLTYGSGTDKRRSEFGKDAAITTQSVDASSFTRPNQPWKGKLREWYWGFDHKHFPLNGRVWYPEETGKFPLVLIVHGNHNMEEHSDVGYEWLGSHLASRGYIAVSVDENFLNFSWPGNLDSETDARAWILLEHLRLWRDWSEDADNLFSGKVDMEHIALMGHSRGGEAAAVAASFNNLNQYPDDATIQFDYGFNIQSVIGIAPEDGLYRPAGLRTHLKDVNYLVVHGGHDMDVSNFRGRRQYIRTELPSGSEYFKTSLWIYRANHGQFNTVWGENDFGFPTNLELNLKSLMPGEEQRQIGKVYFSAFLDATLKDRREYIDMFRDYRVGKDWLPEGNYISRYQDSSFHVVASYDEDPDVTTGAHTGVSITGNNLAVWREQTLPFRNGYSPENSAVYLGWHAEQDELPSYSITLPNNFDLQYGQASSLVFSAAVADERPPDNGRFDSTEETLAQAVGKIEGVYIRIEDSAKQVAELRVTEYGRIPPVLRSRFSKVWNEEDIWGRDWEPIIQHFEIPLADFQLINPALAVTEITRIIFVFDTTSDGVLILDEIGFAASPSTR